MITLILMSLISSATPAQDSCKNNIDIYNQRHKTSQVNVHQGSDGTGQMVLIIDGPEASTLQARVDFNVVLNSCTTALRNNFYFVTNKERSVIKECELNRRTQMAEGCRDAKPKLNLVVAK